MIHEVNGVLSKRLGRQVANVRHFDTELCPTWKVTTSTHDLFQCSCLPCSAAQHVFQGARDNFHQNGVLPLRRANAFSQVTQVPVTECLEYTCGSGLRGGALAYLTLIPA